MNFTIDQYLAGIRYVESGTIYGNYTVVNPRSGAYGAYQITPKYMDYIVTKAGQLVSEISDPAVQDAVAKHWALYYFAEFGNWDLVAVAWHAGGTNARLAQGDTFGPDVTVEQIEAAIPGESRYVLKMQAGARAWAQRDRKVDIPMIASDTSVLAPSVDVTNLPEPEPVPEPAPEPDPDLPKGCLMFWRKQ
jgi:hypothetical protein